MLNKQDLKQHFLGIFEIAIFMRAGVKRFDPDFNMMLKSFLWPLVFLPFAVATSSLVAADQQFMFLLLFNFARIAVTFSISLALVFLVAQKIDRKQYIYHYITTSNWFEIAMFILMLPILGVLSFGGALESMQSYIIFITCLGIVYSGFILTHALRIPWELAALIAISMLFIQETGFDVLEFFKDGIHSI